MVSLEQKELAEYIKSVHLSLRCRTRQIGAENAWDEHLQKEEVLQKYAVAMKTLAEKYWTTNNQKNDEVLCRIQWMVDVILDYFENGTLTKEEIKEMTKFRTLSTKIGVTQELKKEISPSFTKPFKVLDVGSCYNPFKTFPFLDVYPIDLYPACEEVKKCNFVDVEIVHDVEPDWFCEDSIKLPRNFFDIVVFSLVLEYLPSPKLRFIATKKAYDLLKPNALMLIATPDSKHASANAKLMKIWKLALATIGFVQIRIEKLKYLYCMAYRKCLHQNYPLLLYNIMNSTVDPENLLMTPQDSIEYQSTEQLQEKTTHDHGETVVAFEELPFSDYKLT